MRCKQAKILLSAWLDGELTRSEEQALDRHVSGCAACAREKTELRGLQGTMSLWADEEPSEWLAQSFHFKLQELESEAPVTSRDPVRPRWRVFGPATAGFATVLLLGVMLVHNQFQAPTVPTEVKPTHQATVPHTQQPVLHPVRPHLVAPPATSVASGVRSHRAPVHGTVVATTRHTAHTTDAEQAAPVVRPVIPEENKEEAVRTVVASNPERPKLFMSRMAMTGSSAAKIVQPDAAVPDATVLMAAAPANPPLTPSARPATAMEQEIVARIAVASVAQGTSTSKVTDNIGEAGLQMNKNLERVRGTLQEAVDLLVAKRPTPVDYSTYSDGGSTL